MKHATTLYLTLFLLTQTFILANCSWSDSSEKSTYIHASLAEGKSNFKEKNYALAYRQLLPLAVKGSPDAQYAIGYMYYYGKGIDQNEELAESWLRKAAKQGQSHAIQALKEFSKQP